MHQSESFPILLICPLDQLFNCCSLPRNRELMRVFHDLDMVEQLGSGMRRILKCYDENAFSFTEHFMRTSFYFDAMLGDRLGDKLGDNGSSCPKFCPKLSHVQDML